MTPKEKAEELFEAMSGIGDEHHHCTHYVAKQCALIAVDEILKVTPSIISSIKLIGVEHFENVKYWQEVKQEIEKL